jgi:hypothetical protein
MPKRIRSFPIEEKICVVEWHRRNGSVVSKTANEYGIDRKCVRDWDKKYDELKRYEATPRGKKARKMHDGRQPLSVQLDDGLYEFLQKRRHFGLPVSNAALVDEAKRLARELNIIGFKASDGWLTNWKRRFSVGIRRKTNESQALPETYQDDLLGFRRQIIRLRERNDYTLFNIANMDETMVRYDSVADSTNNIRGEKTIRIRGTGYQKKGCTVALTVTASGHKLPALIIFKEKTGQIGPRVRRHLNVPANVLLTASKSGWMTREAMGFWMRRVWGDPQDDVRRLLVLDEYTVHKTAEVREKADNQKTDLVFVPGGCTSLAQPLDVSINKPFKANLRRMWEAWAYENLRGLERVHPSRQNVINWVSESWTSIDANIIVKSFLRCGISNAMDGSEDDEVQTHFPPSEAEIRQEGASLLFSDSESESEFEGFNDSDIED